jgi:hypothetical protein
MTNESIYDGKRLALPDEVWNFRRGDGIEKALMLANFLNSKDNSLSISIEIDGKKVIMNCNGSVFSFISHKDFRKSIKINKTEYAIS